LVIDAPFHEKMFPPILTVARLMFQNSLIDDGGKMAVVVVDYIQTSSKGGIR